MFNYAQVKGDNVISLSQLHSEVTNPALIPLDENGAHNGRVVKLLDHWTGAEFITPEKSHE